MAQINFPVATSAGQQFEGDNGVIYTYVGTPPNGFWSGSFQATGLTTLDSRYLKLDSSNDPITAGLNITGGNVGIGSSTINLPSGQGLQVYNSSSPRIKLANSTTGTGVGDGSLLYISGSDLLIDNKESANMRFYTAATERLRIDSSGNVGVGTASPSSWDSECKNLVVASSDHTGITIAATGSNKRSNLYFSDGTSGSEKYIGGLSYDHADDSLLVRTAATERMRITSSGMIGINENNPGHFIDMNIGSTNVGIKMTSTDAGSYIQFADNSTTGETRVGAVANDLKFDVNNAERLRIDSSGNVLIGNPAGFNSDGVVNIQTAGNKTISFNASQSELGNVASICARNDSGSSLVSFGMRANDLRFATGSSERMRIDSSGKVQIGRTSPLLSTELTVGGDNGLTVGKTNGSRIGMFGSFGQDLLIIGTYDNFPVVFRQNNTERMRIDSSGRVLIGSSTVQTHPNMDDLQLGDGTGNRGLTISSGTSGYGTLAFGDSADAAGTDRYSGSIEYYHADNSMRFYANIGERMRIDSSGNVGIGATSPSSLLTLRQTTASHQIFEISRPNSDSAALFLGNDASNNAIISANNANILFGKEFAGTFTERMRIDNSGNVAVGLTNPVSRLDVSGCGSYPGTAPKEYLYAQDGSIRTIGVESSVDIISEAAGNHASSLLLRGGNVGYGFVNNTDNGTLDLKSFTASADGFTIHGTAGGLGLSDHVSIASITKAGRVGIGTSSPLGKLQVRVVDECNFVVREESTALVLSAETNNGRDNNRTMALEGADFTFTSSGSERMRITSGGRMYLYGNPNLFINNTAGAGTSQVMIAGGHSASSVTSSTLSFRVYNNGNVQNTNNSYGAISDVKLKENIVNASSQWDDLKAIQVRNYNFIEGQTHTQIGVVAQEVELVSPGLVTESPDRDEDDNDLGTVTKSVNYSVLYMKAVKALQEAMERIETLETKVATIEAG